MAPRRYMNIWYSGSDSATWMATRRPLARAPSAHRFNNSDVVEYGAWGDKPVCPRLQSSRSSRSRASAMIDSGGRRDRTPVISRKDTTRSGVEVHTSGSNSGTASMSATVVVPDSTSIRAPVNQACAYSV